ncbi:MAG: DUF2877 domain-containing protein [Jatrophihabitans sp.]
MTPAAVLRTAPHLQPEARGHDTPLRITGRVARPVTGPVFGPLIRATVVGASPAAVYLQLGDGRLLAAVSEDAVALPCSVVLGAPAARLPLGGLRGAAVVGGGLVRLSGLDIVVGDPFETAVTAPTRLDATALRAVRRVAAQSPRSDTGLTEAQFQALSDVSRRGQHLIRSVQALLGGGPGLTPAGDDALCGYLTAAAAGLVPICVADELRHEVALRSGRATTTLSGQLLGYAAAGQAVPQLRYLVDALAGADRVEGCWLDVLAIGHTSGPALAAGFAAALTRIDAR